MNPFQTLGINSIPSKYIIPLPSKCSTSLEKRYVLAAHITWIRNLVSSKEIPLTFPNHESIQEDELQAFISQGKPLPLGPHWMFVLLTVIKSPKNTGIFKPLDTQLKTDQRTNGNMTWPQVVDFIGESNFNYLWEQPQISHFGKEETILTKDNVGVEFETNIYINKLLKNIYINLDESGNNGDENVETERFPVSNLSQPLSVIKIQHQTCEGRDIECFLIFHHYICFSLQDAVTFSPQKCASTSKQMFIAYQILQFLKDFQTIDLPTGDLSLSDFKVDECMYLNVIPWISKIFEQLKMSTAPKIVKGNPEIVAKVKCIVNKVKGWDIDVASSDFNFNLKFVEGVVRHWCEGLITNYDYLMFLNFLCGRFCNGNPNFHPVFPWVSDFTNPMGGWRDFTKSKFRLNKGDRQLDIMYEDIGTTEKTVAHHVTDILSEITFYVYKARITPKEVLCKFVRPKWVPAEYPGSISRMQDWTPDECIPDFFDDPSIFKSIHDDLPDLQVPKWCSSPEDFIKQHLRMLESDHVSAKLHHWIDLNFGYKLSGVAAVKSKNIYLSLADNHQNLESHGVVQLFQTAHPPRKNPLRDIRNTVRYKDLKKLREQEVEDHIHETNSVDSKTKVWKNINLPKHYDPMGCLNDFEVTTNFFKTHYSYLEDTNIVLTGLKDRKEIPSSVKLFGCLLLEIVLPQKFRHASAARNIEDKFVFYKDIVKNNVTLIPLFCRRAIQAIFDKESLEFAIPINISLELLLIGDKVGPIPFPFYFPDIYKMLRTMRNYEKVLATAAPDDVGYRLRLQELKVQSFSRDLIQLLGSLDLEGVDLVLPFVIEIFKNSETRVLAVWNLFCLFAKVIGRKKSVEYLLHPIVQIYESDYHSDKHLKLFHKTFLLQLCNCFGLRTFLEQFSTLLIEAIGGWKLTGDHNEGQHRAHLSTTDLEMDRTDDNTSNLKQKLLSPKKASPANLKRSESEASEAPQPIEPEMFVMEPDISDSEGNETGSAVTTSTNSSDTAIYSFPSVFVNNEPRGSRSPHQSTYGSRYPRDGSTTRSNSASSVGGGGSKSVIDISDVCFESVISLAHRLGPVLTAKYFSKNLLRMLTLCYMDHLELVENQKGLVLNCEGDLHVSKVLDCLMAISDLYGDSFVERQYIPYCVDIINSAKQKLTVTSESALIGVSTVLERIFQYIPDTLLMSQLQDPILKDILSPLVDLICSSSTEFPSGGIPRALLASKYLSMMNYIRKKIGPDLSQLHLRPVLLTICKTFQFIYTGNESAKVDMPGAFDSLLASQIFTNFGDVITGSVYEPLIRDLYLQQGLTDKSGSMREDGSPTSAQSQQKRRIEQQSSFGSRSFGNRIQVQELETTTEETDASVPTTKKDPTRHLRGNWLVYWDHEIGRSDSKFNFKQIKLQTFTGHTGPVRYIYALDNENSFLTASKDKTVKLFSLRNQGDENVVSSCQWTYIHHKKAVLSVLYHEPLHLAASTDGFIHIWDPFVGKLVRILEKSTTAKSSPICALRPILHTPNFVGAGIDSTIHVVDCRTCHAYELKIGIGQASGLVRCLAVSDNGQYISVGHSSGMLSTLDLRNGTLLGSWKGHDGEVLQLVPHRNKQVISSSFDQNISVWNLDENRLSFNIRGPTEPVHSMCTFESELISCTTSNRIGIHCGIDSNSDFSSTRLRSDTFKGVVTSMRLLPLNQFLLLGSESGNVTLLC